ncbi:hypothetical protein [Candidatus Enterococcus huntleyi]|nr:hypothetical protein [Enterococcus sp. JM4C]
MTEEEFFRYLKVALQNLNSTKALQFNVEMEVRRLIKLYTPEEIEKKIK